MAYVKVWFLLISFLADGEPHEVRAPMVSEAECVLAALPYKIGINGVYEITCYEVSMSSAWTRKVHGTAI